MKRLLLLLLVFAGVCGETWGQKAFVTNGGRATLIVGKTPRPVMMSAVEMLVDDWRAVLGAELDTMRAVAPRYDATPRIYAAVAGDPLLEGLGAEVGSIRGRREAFAMRVTQRGDLVIVGSDAHGVAFGLLEVSRMLGVSPWTWWAESVAVKKEELRLPEDFRVVRYPSVEYRGIFINDEDWGLTPWACGTNEPAEKGTVGPKTTEKIFQLLLRLRANTYWPPMHGCSRPFFLTEGNREMAEKYGIYVGTSHCEPMACNANGEWKVRGAGQYNFVTNRDGVMRFWEDRVSAVACQEVIYTLGMRGIHDGPMEGAKNASDRARLTQDVLDAQRGILSRMVSDDVTTVPQVFIPYKEVLDAYRGGMSVPDDVCLMWCDDNYGYIRHFPTESEKMRAGGNGVYYHASYWGRPHDYLWLGTFHPALMAQQMSKAFEKGVRRMWVLNVGDIKPLEYQTELFMDMAWDMGAFARQGVRGHLEAFVEREFVERGLADMLLENYNLAFERKPEHLGNTRTEEKDPMWKKVRDMPWTDDTIVVRLGRCEALVRDVEAARARVRGEQRDAFLHLVEYPVLASVYMNKKMLGAQLARHGKANWADVRAAEDSIGRLTQRYNASAGGKWDKMMNAAPRGLAVFGPAEETAGAALAMEKPAYMTMAGIDARKGDGVRLCEELGHSRKAAELEKGVRVRYDFEIPRKARRELVEMELRFLPTHPMDESGELKVRVWLDGESLGTVDYHTEGRSEEWKENVLRNSAIRRVEIGQVGRGRSHTIAVEALSDGVVLDEIILR